MVKIMTMINGQLKEVDSKEMFEELLKNQSKESKEEAKKVINNAYDEMVRKASDNNSGVVKQTEKIKDFNDEIEDIINDIKNGSIKSLLEKLREKAENCDCPKCQARRTKEKSMNQDKEMINDVLSSIEKALDEVIKEIIESEEDEIVHIEKVYKRISDLEYEISNVVDDLKLKIEEFNDIEIRGIIYGITEKESNRYHSLEEEILDLKVRLTELSKEKRDLIKTIE